MSGGGGADDEPREPDHADGGGRGEGPARDPLAEPGGQAGPEDHETDPLAFPPDERDRSGETARPRREPGQAADAPQPGARRDPQDRDGEPAPAAGPPVEPPSPVRPSRGVSGPASGGRAVRLGPRMGTVSRAVGGRYVLVVAVLLVAVVSVSLLAGKGGHDQPEKVVVGGRLPPFAAPLATGPVTGNANLARRAHQGEAGNVPACSIHRPGVVTSCALLRRGPLVVMTFLPPVARCVEAVDRLDRAVAADPRVQGLAVAISGDQRTVRPVVAERGWRIPVVDDEDGALTLVLQQAPVCPVALFVDRGGRITGKLAGRELTSARLRAAIARLATADTRPREATGDGR